jgi:hypothetical protein
MRFELVPRLSPRQGRATDGDDPMPASLGSGEEINQAVLSGVIVSEPIRDTGRDGAPITVLLLAFPAPDERARDTSTCCEVEVLDSIADRHRRGLRVGRRVRVVGQLTGVGLWASALDI